MAFFLGIDIGSGFSKAVIFDGKAVQAWAIIPSGGNYRETAEKIAEDALIKAVTRWNNDVKNHSHEKPLDSVDYEKITKKFLNQLDINSAEKIILIKAGIAWGEYQLIDLDEQTRNFLGGEIIKFKQGKVCGLNSKTTRLSN